MNELKFTGIITAISAKQSGETTNGKHWEKQKFVVTEQKDLYPQSLLVEAFNKSELIENLQEGDEVEVTFNVNAKEYKGAFYGSNQLWKINVLNKAQSAENDPQNSIEKPQTVAPALPLSDDDLPF